MIEPLPECRVFSVMTFSGSSETECPICKRKVTWFVGELLVLARIHPALSLHFGFILSKGKVKD